MKKYFVCAVLALCVSVSGYSWGRIGHETITKIAENHLTPKAKRQIEKYLGGQSIVYYAKYMDEVRKTPDYLFTDGWHTAKCDSLFHYIEGKKEKGDVMKAIDYAIANLQDYKELSDSAVAFNIKVLLHFVGDMHCPSHIHYPGNNNVKVTLEDNYHFFQPYKSHAVWDNAMFQYHRAWSETEWAGYLDRISRKEFREITKGNHYDWFEESAARCSGQWEWISEGAKLGQDFLNYALPLAEEQILLAGCRLASVLNAIF